MSLDPNLVGAFLEDILKSKGITNYGAITARFGLPDFDGAWAAHPLSNIFETLDKQDANANRPFRTSAVVAVASNSPGAGLFEALERLKNIPDQKTKNAREKIWLSELDAAYAHSW